MSEKILIIEDEISIAELERDYLEINGYEVEIEYTGKKGLERLQKNHFDLVIVDIMLPEMDGFEVCKKIREYSDIPVMIVSAKKEDIDKIRGLGIGADDYMTKPFSPNELVARVKAHLGRFRRLVGKDKMQKELVIRNLSIYPDARRVLLDEKELVFTTKEYDLLFFLATNPDKVFSKEVLLDRIWGMDAYVDTATVTVHIGKIRDKIDKDKKKGAQFIETVWGAGYRFNV